MWAYTWTSNNTGGPMPKDAPLVWIPPLGFPYASGFNDELVEWWPRQSAELNDEASEIKS